MSCNFEELICSIPDHNNFETFNVTLLLQTLIIRAGIHQTLLHHNFIFYQSFSFQKCESKTKIKEVLALVNLTTDQIFLEILCAMKKVVMHF